MNVILHVQTHEARTLGEKGLFIILIYLFISTVCISCPDDITLSQNKSKLAKLKSRCHFVDKLLAVVVEGQNYQ